MRRCTRDGGRPGAARASGLTAPGIAGAYLALVGAAVAIHSLLDPLIYDASREESLPPAWIALDWLMAVGLAVVLAVTVRATRAADAGS